MPLCCFAKVRTGDTWRNIRRELERLHGVHITMRLVTNAVTPPTRSRFGAGSAAVLVFRGAGVLRMCNILVHVPHKEKERLAGLLKGIWLIVTSQTLHSKL